MRLPVEVLKLQPLLLRLKPAFGHADCFCWLLPALLLLHCCCSCCRGLDPGCKMMLEKGVFGCIQINALVLGLAFAHEATAAAAAAETTTFSHSERNSWRWPRKMKFATVLITSIRVRLVVCIGQLALKLKCSDSSPINLLLCQCFQTGPR